MKLSENDVFIRKMRKLLENNSIYNVGLNINLLKLIEEHEEEPCRCHDKICFEVSDREKE